MDPMSDFSLYSVGGIGSDHSRSSNADMETHAHKSEPLPTAQSSVPMNTFPGHTRLVFQVDESKNEVVVLIVDEASSKVIRTVPGDAMRDLPTGGLIQRNA
jgi:uncharacterized FlaG/YvyC family protein